MSLSETEDPNELRSAVAGPDPQVLSGGPGTTIRQPTCVAAAVQLRHGPSPTGAGRHVRRPPGGIPRLPVPGGGIRRSPTCHSSCGCDSSPGSGCNWSTGSTWARSCATRAARCRCNAGPCRRPPATSLAAQLLGRFTSVTQAVRGRAEMQLILQEAVNGLDPIDREILQRCGTSRNSPTKRPPRCWTSSRRLASNRHVRALKRLRDRAQIHARFLRQG